jgi:outer membrane protein
MQFKTIAPVVTLATLALVSLPAAADLKIAVVHPDAVFQKPSQDARTALEAEFTKREADLKAIQDKLEEDAKNFQRDADTMTADQRSKKERDLRTRKLDLDDEAQKLSQDEKVRQQQVTMSITNRVNAALQAVAKDKGFDLVIQNAAYVSPVVPDITEEVIKKVASTPAEPLPAAAPAKK